MTNVVGALEGTRYPWPQALSLLALATGMRQGELLGLQWSAIDLEGRWLSVRRSAQRQSGRGVVFVSPKTARGSAWRDQNLVFPTASGRPIGAGGLRRAFADDLKRAGLPQIRFNDLRHTAWTLMTGGGIHDKVVSEMLGHSSIAIPLDTHSHVLPGMQDEAAAALDRVFGR
jgi:integrase